MDVLRQCRNCAAPLAGHQPAFCSRSCFQHYRRQLDTRYCTRDGCTNRLTRKQPLFCSARCKRLHRNPIRHNRGNRITDAAIESAKRQYPSLSMTWTADTFDRCKRAEPLVAMAIVLERRAKRESKGVS